MENKITYQKLRKNVDDKYQLAEKYYSLISVINDLRLTEREIQVVAYTAVRGNMTYANVREDFCKKYNTTFPTINNIISKMRRLKVLVKEDRKVKINPALALDFENDIVLQMTITHGHKG